MTRQQPRRPALAWCLPVFLFLFTLSATASLADPDGASDNPEPATAAGFTDEVTVTGTREERRVDEVPAAIGVVGEAALDGGRRESLDGYLGTIPGIDAASNDGGSDVKIAIRGFGARSTFGVRDLLVLVDGVAITDADGFTRLDQIDLASTERIEVVKGPASALYGNAAFGGVVNVITRHGAIGDTDRRLRLEAGELGHAKVLASVAGGSAARRTAYALHLSNAELDGFRDHNDTAARRLNGSLDSFRSERTTLRFLLNMSQMRDEIPGSLNRQQLESDPSQVRPLFSLFDHRRDDDRYRLGTVVEHQPDSQSQLEGRLFVLTRELDHPIFQVIDQSGLRFMGGVRYSRDLETGSLTQRLTVGIDGDREDIDSQRFRNVFGERGELVLSADETVASYAVYVQDELTPGPRWRITLGGRYDHIRFGEDDRLLTDGDQSDRRTFERVSPKLGVLWSQGAALNVFLNLATAFQVPTKSELTSTVGEHGFNRELEPQLARHAELGLRGTWSRRLRYEMSLFQTDVDDEILPRTQIEGTTIYGNVGETRHRGVEASLDLLLPAALELRLGYGWSDNVFTDLAGVTGNVLPGFPEHRGTLTLATRRGGLNGSVVFERVGTTYLDDANRETRSPYSVVHAGLSYDWRRFSFFLHGTNLADERYAGWVAVNDPAGNFFLPSPGRAFTAGVDVRF